MEKILEKIMVAVRLTNEPEVARALNEAIDAYTEAQNTLQGMLMDLKQELINKPGFALPA